MSRQKAKKLLLLRYICQYYFPVLRYIRQSQMVRNVFFHVDFDITFLIDLNPLWLWVLGADRRQLRRIEQGLLNKWFVVEKVIRFRKKWEAFVKGGTCPKRQCSSIDSKVSFSLTDLLEHHPQSVSGDLERSLFLSSIIFILVANINDVPSLSSYSLSYPWLSWKPGWVTLVQLDGIHLHTKGSTQQFCHLYKLEIANRRVTKIDGSWHPDKAFSLTLLAGRLRSSSSRSLSMLVFVFSSLGTKVTVTFISLQSKRFHVSVVWDVQEAACEVVKTKDDKKNGERPGEDELVIVEVARPPILLLWLLLLRKGKPENRLKSGDTGITGVWGAWGKSNKLGNKCVRPPSPSISNQYLPTRSTWSAPVWPGYGNLRHGWELGLQSTRWPAADGVLPNEKK